MSYRPLRVMKLRRDAGNDELASWSKPQFVEDVFVRVATGTKGWAVPHDYAGYSGVSFRSGAGVKHRCAAKLVSQFRILSKRNRCGRHCQISDCIDQGVAGVIITP